MHDDIINALRILAAAAGLAVVTWLGVVLLRATKRGGGGMQALGAAMMLFGWGSMRDPSNNPVKEAQDGRLRRGESGADPLDPW
jgi:predicted phage tail protein